tara:strand:- start:100 stop:1332 length:1233 start_codon:yes stop_codon:yes gene_type:complete
MKITKRQLRRIIKEEMYRGSLINLGSSNGHRTFRGDPRLFERSYVTGILGIPLSLQESYPYSATIERQVIREQILYENWWGDDWYLFEGAYGELLKTHSAGVLLDKLHEGPILDWGKGLLSTAAQKGKEAVDKGLEAGKEALMSAKEGIKKFGKAGWNILSAMWLTMKGGASEIGSWVKSVVRMSISGLVEGIKKALKFLATKLPEWKMPTFGAAAQKGLDFITKLQDKLQTLEGWEGVVAVSGIAIGLHWLWDKVGEWVDELKEKVGGKFTDTFEGATGTEGGIEAIKKWIKDTAKEKLTAFGGDALKKVMETLASAATGVKPWWDAAVKVGKGTKLAIDALGDAAARFMRVKGPEKVTIENVTRGNTMRLTKKQLRRIIREAINEAEFYVNRDRLVTKATSRIGYGYG